MVNCILATRANFGGKRMRLINSWVNLSEMVIPIENKRNFRNLSAAWFVELTQVEVRARETVNAEAASATLAQWKKGVTNHEADA